MPACSAASCSVNARCAACGAAGFRLPHSPLLLRRCRPCPHSSPLSFATPQPGAGHHGGPQAGGAPAGAHAGAGSAEGATAQLLGRRRREGSDSMMGSACRRPGCSAAGVQPSGALLGTSVTCLPRAPQNAHPDPAFSPLLPPKQSIRANIKVSSTETGAIFGNLVYESTGYADRRWGTPPPPPPTHTHTHPHTPTHTHTRAVLHKLAGCAVAVRWFDSAEVDAGRGMWLPRQPLLPACWCPSLIARLPPLG